MVTVSAARDTPRVEARARGAWPVWGCAVALVLPLVATLAWTGQGCGGVPGCA